MTTHSPVALRELSGNQLFVMRGSTERHEVRVVGTADDTQSTIRLYPDAFLAPNVLVCEGAPRSSASCAACYSDQQRKNGSRQRKPRRWGERRGGPLGMGISSHKVHREMASADTTGDLSASSRRGP